jgi:hypothetical protein
MGFYDEWAGRRNQSKGKVVGGVRESRGGDRCDPERSFRRHDLLVRCRQLCRRTVFFVILDNAT